MGKKKHKKKKKKDKSKKVQRILKKTTFPCTITIHDPKLPYMDKHINEERIVRFTIKDRVYSVRYNHKNQCIEFYSKDRHCYLQPIDINKFLVK